MGLDISVGRFSFKAGSYSGFAEFRRRLATLALGINLETMDGLGGGGDWGDIQSGLAVLLSHSDCDGDIKPEDAKDLLDALKRHHDDLTKNKREAFPFLLKTAPEEREWYLELLKDWIKACKISVRHKEPIIFS